MYDIIANPDLEQKAREIGLEPLILGKEVQLVDDAKKVPKEPFMILLGTSSDRTLVEAPIDGMVDLELIEKKDHLHYRRSGLTQVNAKILAKDKKVLLLSLSALKKAAQPGMVLGRMIQNTQIARKAKLPVLLASFAETDQELVTTHDLEAFFRSLGINEKLVKKSQKEFSNWIKRAKLRSSEKYEGEGISRSKTL